jgi:hypothetical protein
MNKASTIFNAANEMVSIINGTIQAGLAGPEILMLAPWTTGRSAGLGAHNLKQGRERNEFLGFAEGDTFEGYSLRSSLSNKWQETKGVIASFIPFMTSTAATGTALALKVDVNMPALITLSTTAHLVGGYLLSRHYAKNRLAQTYEAGYAEHYQNNVANNDNTYAP